MLGRLFLGNAVPIIEDYDGIARRLRELKPSATPSAKDADLTDKWRGFAEETARAYVQNRRRGPMADSILPNRREAEKRR